MMESTGALAVTSGRLTARDPAIERRLTAALALAPDAPPETCVALLRLHREGKRPLELCVVSIGDGFVTVLISDPVQRVAPDSNLLTSLYRFTPAEARIVRAMLGGSTPAATASDLGISVNTVRRHLKQIFAKTRVRRQADLLRLVSSGLGSLQMRAGFAGDADSDL
jgi:DNA-binding CsgD family transcriptional regulator